MECLESVHSNPLPKEIIVVIDDVGRSLISNFDYKVEEDINKTYPDITVLHNDNFDSWNMVNQTFNVGLRAAKSEYVMLTHEDVLFQKADYFGFNITTNKDNVIGITFPYKQLPPEYEGATYDFCEGKVIALYTPISSIIQKSFLESVGWLDEEYGIWYDVYVQNEAILKHKCLIGIHTLPILHKVSQSLRANNWGNGFSKCYKWAFFPDNYKKKYGSEVGQLLEDTVSS